ncbi:hypothetical protein [Lentibacter sp. XHP0401]|uniref:hypothetical protein n=1 Tax=Lentibacter sp. XHP0401 TaxID=2984334 RepID=UPI0021E717AC|nr:hypothetical protein [Lentibacter sp. XHP0401]
MSERVTIFLEPEMKASAEAGQHNFLAKVEAVLRGGGLSVHYANEAERDEPFEGRALVHMWPPMSADTLVMRRVYAYPFWAIEPSDKRWEWSVAGAVFDPEGVNGSKAARFVGNWRKRLFGVAEARREGYVYVPLQGRISERRSFQAASPLEMIEALLEAESKRSVVIGLHPKENYAASDIDALEKFEHRFERVSVVMGQMEQYLPGCDYVVSQNSGAAFFGYFFEKPVALFGKIDFHHIAANVHELGVEEALARVPDMTPDFERYLWWFWQEKSINAGRDEAEEQIAVRFKLAGWIA